jgi:hypothetical protein
MWMLTRALSLQNIIGWKILCKDFDWGSWLKLNNIEVIVMKCLQHLYIYISVNIYVIFKLERLKEGNNITFNLFNFIQCTNVCFNLVNFIPQFKTFHVWNKYMFGHFLVYFSLFVLSYFLCVVGLMLKPTLF